MASAGESDQTIRDPEGFEALLTERCWTGHITKHHPELRSFRERVIQTIEAPDAIHLGHRDRGCRIYTRRYSEVPDVGYELTLLVYVRSETGYVATAHFAAHSIRRLGPQIWPSR